MHAHYSLVLPSLCLNTPLAQEASRNGKRSPSRIGRGPVWSDDGTLFLGPRGRRRGTQGAGAAAAGRARGLGRAALIVRTVPALVTGAPPLRRWCRRWQVLV